MQTEAGQGEFTTLQNTAVYAPADFPDADIRPTTNIVTAVSNVVLYSISETVDKQQQSKTWRRKVRDILQNHQELILQFFTKQIPGDHPLKAAHILLTKYGKFNPSLIAELPKNPPQFFKDCLIDVPQTGTTAINEYLAKLLDSKTLESPVNRWTNMTRHMLDYMRDVGDELIRLDQKLKDECAHLDSVSEKVQQIVGLPNPGLEGFEDMMEQYIMKQFENHPIQAIFWDYIFTLQKYTVLRDILIPQRMANISEPICCICTSEPIVIALVPCGHTFCTNCSKRTIVCHICRQAVTNRLRVFFG